MFSLFTQVWLWSVAAFAFGVLLTWLLFVLPLRRRSKRLAAELQDVLAHGEYADDGSEYDEPFDLLEPDPAEAGDEPRAGTGRGWDDDPDDLHRALTTAPYVTRRPVATPGWGGEGASATEDPPTRPAVPPTEQPAAAAPAEPGRARAEDFRDDRAGTERSRAADPVAPAPVPAEPVAEQPTEQPAQQPVGVDQPAEQPVQQPAEQPAAEPPAQQPAAGAEQPAEQPEPPHWSAGALDPERAERFAGNLRWQRPVLNGTAGEHGIEEAPESGLRGSLFDPQAERAEDGEADSTQVIPRVTEDGEQPAALPRRTPGSGPRPGREGGGGGAPVVKGHSASRQYHTPASPHYTDIPADVWFRTPVDAEIAGFEPWDGRRAR